MQVYLTKTSILSDIIDVSYKRLKENVWTTPTKKLWRWSIQPIGTIHTDVEVFHTDVEVFQTDVEVVHTKQNESLITDIYII